MREKILYHTAFIETALDDPEHISVDGYGETLKKVVDEIIEAMKRLLDSCDDGRIIKRGCTHSHPRKTECGEIIPVKCTSR